MPFDAHARRLWGHATRALPTLPQSWVCASAALEAEVSAATAAAWGASLIPDAAPSALSAPTALVAGQGTAANLRLLLSALAPQGVSLATLLGAAAPTEGARAGTPNGAFATSYAYWARGGQAPLTPRSGLGAGLQLAPRAPTTLPLMARPRRLAPYWWAQTPGYFALLANGQNPYTPYAALGLARPLPVRGSGLLAGLPLMARPRCLAPYWWAQTPGYFALLANGQNPYTPYAALGLARPLPVRDSGLLAGLPLLAALHAPKLHWRPLLATHAAAAPSWPRPISRLTAGLGLDETRLVRGGTSRLADPALISSKLPPLGAPTLAPHMAPSALSGLA